MAGCRSKYDPDNFPELVRAEARKGHTEKELAQILGVSMSTFSDWKNKHPEFLAALKEGKAPANAKVEAALYKRAIGYSYQESKIIQNPDGTQRVEVTTKEVLPDVTAQIFFLKNRCPVDWRDKQQLEHTGQDGGPLEVTHDISPETAAVLKQLYRDGKV